MKRRLIVSLITAGVAAASGVASANANYWRDNGLLIEVPDDARDGTDFLRHNATHATIRDAVSAPGLHAIDLTLNGGAGPFSFLWSNMATTEDLANLPPGTYSVTVNGGGSCTATADFFVPDNPNAPDLSFSVVPSTCGLSNGSVNLTVGPGVPPYTYQWSNGLTTQDINGLIADIYIVTVTGANGCSSQEGVIVDDTQVPININDNIQPQTSCLINNGSISLTITPAGSSLVWSSGQTTPSITGLPAGDYTVTVTVGSNCVTTETFTVDDNTDYPAVRRNLPDRRGT